MLLKIARRLPWTLVLSVSLFAGEAPVVPGFYDVSSPLVPRAVAQSARHVFKIMVLDPQPLGEIPSLKDLEKSEQGVLTELEDTPLVRQLLSFQFQLCRREKQFPCPIYGPAGTGSAFLLEDSQTLWTDYHVIEPFVKSLAEQFKRPEWMAHFTLQHQNLPIALFDSNHNMVFVTDKKSTRATVVTKPFDHHGSQIPSDASYRQSSDFVQIRLSKPVGQPLRLASKPTEVGQAVYAIGYPRGTGPYSENSLDAVYQDIMVTRDPYPNSTGRQLYVSIGKILSYQTVVERVGPLDSLGELDRIIDRLLVRPRQLDLEQLVFAQVDAGPGNSGGPLVNADGEVVGMAQSFMMPPGGTYRDAVVFSTNLKTILQKIESRVKFP